VAYPRQHARPGGLFDRVLDHGGWLLSELLPGTEPKPHAVLSRNRIVAGLADAVVVVEGGARSGALRTAACAGDLGVPVLAVPGDVRAPGSAAPHRLLGEGAAPCASPDDLLATLGETAEPGQDAAVASCLPPDVAACLGRRWPRPVPVDVLAEQAGVTAGPLLAALTRAQVAGEVVRAPEGVRLTRAPRSTT
jgi:DNA processing protein